MVKTLGDYFISLGCEEVRKQWLETLDEDDLLALYMELRDREWFPDKFETSKAE